MHRPSTCRAISLRCKVWVDVSRFSPWVINLSPTKYFCCGLKKVVAKSRAGVYLEQQILALLLVFHQTRNLSWIHTKQISQSVRCISSTRNKCFCCTTSCLREVNNRLKTCNETMLRDKLRILYLVFLRL